MRLQRLSVVLYSKVISIVGHNIAYTEVCTFNPFMHNVPNWSDTLCSKCRKIFKVCLTILGHCALKG